MATSTNQTMDKGTNRTARLNSLYNKLDELDLAAYWAVENAKNDHDEDGQVLKGNKALPFIWKYAEIEPLL